MTLREEIAEIQAEMLLRSMTTEYKELIPVYTDQILQAVSKRLPEKKVFGTFPPNLEHPDKYIVMGHNGCLEQMEKELKEDI